MCGAVPTKKRMGLVYWVQATIFRYIVSSSVIVAPATHSSVFSRDDYYSSWISGR